MSGTRRERNRGGEPGTGARRATLLTIFLLGSLLLGGAAAHQDAPDQPIPSELEERVEVRLLTLDFLVTDRKGAPITDLRPEEVRISSGKKEIPVAFLERVEEPPPWAGEPLPPAEIDFRFGAEIPPLPMPESHRPRWVLFLLDRFNIGPDTRKRAVKAARSFLQGKGPAPAWREGDRAGVVLYDRLSPCFVLEGFFTSDPDRVIKALEEPGRCGPDPNTSRARQMVDLMDDLTICRDHIDPAVCSETYGERYVRQRAVEGRHFLENLGAAASILGTVPGHKYLVLFSHGFSSQPSAEAADLIEAIVGAQAGTQYRAGLVEPLGREIDDFLETAARNEVTLFAIDSRTQSSGMLNAAFRDLTNTTGTPPNDPILSAFRDARSTLATLADGTGGRHYIGKDASAKLEQAFRAVDGLYTAGYHEKDLPGSRKKVKLRVTRPGVEVSQARRPREEGPLPDTIRMLAESGEAEAARGPMVRVPVTVTLDPTSMPFRMDGDLALCHLSVHLALLDARKRTVAEIFHFIELEYPREPFEEGRVRPPRYQGSVAAPPGDYLLEVSLRDPGGKGGIFYDMPLRLEAPAPD
jgi:VWFA-related protein